MIFSKFDLPLPSPSFSYSPGNDEGGGKGGPETEQWIKTNKQTLTSSKNTQSPLHPQRPLRDHRRRIRRQSEPDRRSRPRRRSHGEGVRRPAARGGLAAAPRIRARQRGGYGRAAGPQCRRGAGETRSEDEVGGSFAGSGVGLSLELRFGSVGLRVFEPVRGQEMGWGRGCG